MLCFSYFFKAFSSYFSFTISLKNDLLTGH